jgi:hypothetical protein
MTHVTDELELYTLGTLAPLDAARVAAHLTECPVCREQARAIEDVIHALPETLPASEVPARLRERILASARAELVPARVTRRENAWTARRLVQPLLVAVTVASLAVAVLVLGTQNLQLSRDLTALQNERNEYETIAEGIRQGGRWWYMTGKDEWAGSGGTLIAPRVDGRPPFVLFHDLKPLPAGKVYTVWLVNDQNIWVRGAAFRPELGKDIQSVDVTAPIAGFDRCAVTVEDSAWGRRAGPVVMESRIAVPTTPAN